ncbi:high affinity cationic amino acid transporter 1 [Nasonia vitripennis]|uniref:Cationic amino acid transporter C-terminal domain-containing protein n=1 Tax=Nasonia vitripennis TaxID=7425 RepID=A0A7M7GCQ0_NASVI|nr:high affinity cationic amino acid transporter 1 [Nasonia vitripennis]XP_003424872.1 high affinity cationic amino acid transporter 1 [Nasonia vitripennis]
MTCARLWRALSRRRQDDELTAKSELARVLGIIDLTALGVGSTLGLGVYVLAGSVAKDTAGPAVCISFLIAAIASAFAGMCYAEFSSRVPKAGSAYVYSYVTVGEFIAFVIGWNLILEYVIGTASMARGVSSYIDVLTNYTIERALHEAMPIKVSFLSQYPDFFALGMVILLTLFLSIGVKESSMLNNVFTTINLITISIIVVSGIIKADPSNWSIDVLDIPMNVTNPGTGGFMPFGIKGVMEGAAICFYGFVGFDAVATTGEEAKNPQRNIPLAIVLSLAIIFLAYFSISTVLTMMWPYYDQDAQAPFPYVYDQIGWPTVKWIVNIGAVFALCTSLLGAMFPLPRVLYAMASDGVIFKFLATVHPKTMTPLLGTALSGLLTGIMTLLFDLQQLINMMSIGTLLAYTIVAVSVLILRYQKEELSTQLSNPKTTGPMYSTPANYFKQIFNLYNQKEPTHFSTLTAKYAVLLFGIIVFIIGILVNNCNVLEGKLPSVIFAILALLALLTATAIGRQPVQQIELSFKVPLVPFIPCLSIMINLYLMLQLDMNTWIRFAAWMVIGFCIYFFYGVRHSVQGERERLEAETLARKYADQVQVVTKC